jgi:hypothetical protein
MQSNIGTVGQGPICSVAIGVSAGTLIRMDGDSGSARVSGSTLSLSCSSGGKQIMAATIDCYQGAGHYTIPAGTLMLGGQLSDRDCSLDADIEGQEVRGFISCVSQPADPNNIFANTQPPIGLGSYDLPMQ